MRLSTRTAMLILLIFIAAPAYIGQSTRCTDPTSTRRLLPVRENPSLAVDYSKVAKFKLASRKSIYRVGEIITFDLAMLNTAKDPIFFMELLPSTVTILAYDQNQLPVDVHAFTVYQLGYTAKLYTLLNPNVITLGSFHLLAGCSDAEGMLRSKNKILSEFFNEGDLRIFDQNLFVTWGDACVPTKGEQTFTFKAELTNTHVVASSCEPRSKTALGKIESEHLKIRVLD